MPITDYLRHNAAAYGNEIALVEINPEVLERKHVTWRGYDLIESTDPENVKSEHDDDPSVIAKCKYFTVKKHELSSGDKELFAGEESFMHIMCVKGRARFIAGGKEYALSPADTYFVPAGTGKVTLLSSDAVIITTTM